MENMQNLNKSLIRCTGNFEVLDGQSNLLLCNANQSNIFSNRYVSWIEEHKLHI